MLFNIEKCKVMHFGHHNQEMDYTLDNRVLQKVYEERDLGVIISVDLKALLQCFKAYSTANRILGVINRSNVYKSRNILLNLYKSLVRPFFSTAQLYGVPTMLRTRSYWNGFKEGLLA